MRRIILSCALAGVLAVPAKSQSLREQLVGAWALVSCNPNAQALTPTCGTNPNGILINDASGRYAWVVALRGRPKASGDRSSTPAEELGTLARGLTAQFGTWSVNEADKTHTIHIDGALFPNVEGTEGTATVSVSGDELRIGGNVYRRIKR
jgi:hypothetical protein